MGAAARAAARKPVYIVVARCKVNGLFSSDFGIFHLYFIILFFWMTISHPTHCLQNSQVIYSSQYTCNFFMDVAHFDFM